MKLLIPGRALAVAVLVVAQAHAQTPPDAGSLLREQPKPPAAVPGPALSAPAKPGADRQDSGPTVKVLGFRVEGSLLIPEAELVGRLKRVVGMELSFSQLQDIATSLSDYYTQRGYIARVVLPPQDIKDGIVRFKVIEGQRGSMRIENRGQRIDTARVQGMLDRRVTGGAGMNVDALEEALNIINDQPGIAARAALAPGKGEGDIDVVVSTVEKPLTVFGLNANNQGSSGTGEFQAGASLSLANPSGAFDAASVLVNSSRGGTYARADYSLAVGNSGLRVGVNASDLSYHLTQSTFAALQANGTARTLGATASYPIVHRRQFRLGVTGSLDRKILVDRTVAGETGDREVTVAGLALNGYAVGNPDNPLGENVSSFSIGLSGGQSDQRNAAARAADSTTRQIQGSFTKVGYSAGHLRPLASALNLNLSLRGQFASKNLDSTERFSLGGPYGVRAYPVGEAIGDEGWIASVSLAHKASETLMFSVFVDSGSVTLNRNLYANWNAANPNLPNRYQLSGIGAGLDWRLDPRALLTVSIATPIGSNPGRDANNLNVDSRRNGTRGWVGLTAQF